MPAYQEAPTIEELLARVLACDVGALGFEREILVCDDGSTDGTGAIVARVARTNPDVHLFTHAENRGKGAAVRTLLRHATGECVLVQDADLEYDAADTLTLLARFRAGADAVYGSRFLQRRWPRGMRPANLIANRVLTATANALYGLALTDEATCLKLVRRSLLEAMDLRRDSFDFCPEVTAKLGLMGIRIEEVPVSYVGRDGAQGKKVRWRDGVAALRELLVRRLSGWAPRAGG